MTNSKKTKLTIEEVKHVAKLANLAIQEEEIIKFQNQLSETIDYIEELCELDKMVANLPGTYQVTGMENKLREDIVKPSLPKELALQNAKRVHNGFFVVPSVWD